MDRYLEVANSATPPSAPPASSGYPTNGNPMTATPATEPGEWWFHMVTEEVRNVILAAALTPDHTNLGQLAAAIQILIGASAQSPGAVIYVAQKTAPSGYLKANGAALSRTYYAALFAALVTNSGFTSQSFTVTLATPAVFTKASHGFSGGERLRLSTTGALPTGLNATTDYFVEVIDANTFYLNTSAYVGGTRVATSGAQSGTHSFLQSWFGLGDGATTFNLPDLRGEFLRGWDDSRGVDSGRAFGSAQKGSLLGFDTGATVPDGCWNVSVQNNPTVAAAQATLGTDAYTTTDYNGAAISGASVASYMALPGSDGNQGASGVIRSRNVGLLACIKY